MNKAEKENIKQNVLMEIQKTELSIIEYKKNTKIDSPDCAVGRVSRMDEINNKSVTKAALFQAEEKLKKLKYVLSIVDNDDFGLCARCKRPIPLGRILLMPQSVHCVNCAN